MESFLASRPTITKLGATAKPGTPVALETIITRPPAAGATVPVAATENVLSPAPSLHSHGTHGARVEVVRENERVTGIVVVCSCGERIELDCVY